MKLNKFLLDAGTVAPWVSTTMPILRIVFIVICAICALALIIIVMNMESNPEGGSNIITGSNDSFYSQNMSSTKEGRLKKAMIVFSIILAVCAILFCCTYGFYNGTAA